VALAAVQRDHQLAGQLLARGVLLGELAELGDDLGVAAALQVGVDPRFDRREPLLVQPGDLGLRERLEGELRQRRAAAEAQGSKR
jgi:hypothetical protein